MQLLRVRFVTNIDFYSTRTYPTYLPFRPQIGDEVPFVGQHKKEFKNYPLLVIKDVKYHIDHIEEPGKFSYFECYLGFNKDIYEETRIKILNHQKL